MARSSTSKQAASTASTETNVTGRAAKAAAKPAAGTAAAAPARPPSAAKQAAASAKAPAEEAMMVGKTTAVPGTAKPGAKTKDKAKKVKLVRDSLIMPEAEYAALGEVKKACLEAGIAVKKSELLRVGVVLIRQLDTARLKEILDSLPALKARHPKKRK
jgi:hypothetical protein